MPWRVKTTSMRTLFLAMTSAALKRVVPGPERQCGAGRGRGPPTKAMSCSVVGAPSGSRPAYCLRGRPESAQSGKSMHSAMKRVLSSTVFITGLRIHLASSADSGLSSARLPPEDHRARVEVQEPTSCPLLLGVQAHLMAAGQIELAACGPPWGYCLPGGMLVFTLTSMRACRLSRSASFCTL